MLRQFHSETETQVVQEATGLRPNRRPRSRWTTRDQRILTIIERYNENANLRNWTLSELSDICTDFSDID